MHVCAYSKLILVPISRKSYRAYTYTKVLIHVLVLLSILYLFRSPVGVTKLIPIRRYLYMYLYFYLSYTCLDLPLKLQSLYLYRDTYTRTCTFIHLILVQISRRSYRAYTCTTELILVLRNLYLYYGAYTCTTELILVLRSLYLYYRAYTCTKVPVGTTDPILVQRYP